MIEFFSRIDLMNHVMLAPKLWSVTSGEEPFAYHIIDNFLEPDFAQLLSDEFPSYGDHKLRPYNNPLETKKLQNYWDHFQQNTYRFIQFINSSSFIDQYVSPLVGVSSLVPDYGLNGAGQFLHERCGKLNPHLDYRIHPKLGLERRFSFLLYLTPGWDEAWGGDLVLYSGTAENLVEHTRISCNYNRAVIFDTTSNSWHGVPDPLDCPIGILRKTIGVFYLSERRKDVPDLFKAQYALLGDDNYNSELVNLVKRRSDPAKCRSTYEAD